MAGLKRSKNCVKMRLRKVAVSKENALTSKIREINWYLLKMLFSRFVKRLWYNFNDIFYLVRIQNTFLFLNLGHEYSHCCFRNIRYDGLDPKTSQNELHFDHDLELEVWRHKHWQFSSSRIPEKNTKLSIRKMRWTFESSYKFYTYL